MADLIHKIFLDSKPGELTELHAAGTTLENPYVYDSVARDLKSMADRGLVRIDTERVGQDRSDPLIRNITFERLR